MPIDTDIFASDLSGMISDLPSTMKYGGREFAVSVSDKVRRTDLQLNGEIEEIDFTVELLSGSVDGLPAIEANTRIEIKRPGEAAYTSYEVVRVTKPADAVGLTLAVKSDRRN